MRHALSVAAGTLLLTGCISVTYARGGETVTQDRDLAAFDRLEASRGVEIVLSCGPAAKAVLHGDSGEVAQIETRVEGHTLIVRRASAFGDHDTVHIDVTTTQPLGRIEASSGSTVEVPSCATATDRLDLEASSGAELKVAGKTGRLTAEASSGATITRPHGERLDARDAEISASSGGSVRVCGIGHLDGRASSGGSVATEQAGPGDRSSSFGGDFSTRRCD